jgi:hypothetical protein
MGPVADLGALWPRLWEILLDNTKTKVPRRISCPRIGAVDSIATFLWDWLVRYGPRGWWVQAPPWDNLQTCFTAVSGDTLWTVTVTLLAMDGRWNGRWPLPARARSARYLIIVPPGEFPPQGVLGLYPPSCTQIGLKRWLQHHTQTSGYCEDQKAIREHCLVLPGFDENGDDSIVYEATTN